MLKCQSTRNTVNTKPRVSLAIESSLCSITLVKLEIERHMHCKRVLDQEAVT